jgi:starvation-inducible DNA-binding protein
MLLSLGYTKHGHEVQRFGTVWRFPLGLSYEARQDSCQRLSHLLADSRILYFLYKKNHWLMRGTTFYQLHLLLDKHADEQMALAEYLVETPLVRLTR